MKRILLLAFLAGCSSAAKSPATVSNTGTDEPQAPAAELGFTDGALWTCQIADYDPQPCKLGKAGEVWSLVKVMGSQRFKGTIGWTDSDTAEFVGKFFCPWGDCTESMNVTFKRDAGNFVTDFGGDAISLRYDAALANEWGGAGYGSLTGDEQ